MTQIRSISLHFHSTPAPLLQKINKKHNLKLEITYLCTFRVNSCLFEYFRVLSSKHKIDFPLIFPTRFTPTPKPKNAQKFNMLSLTTLLFHISDFLSFLINFWDLGSEKMQILPKFSLHLSLKKVKKVLKIDIFLSTSIFWSLV